MHVLSADDLTQVFSAHAVIFQAAGNKNEESNANTEAYLVEQQVKYWWSNRNSVCVFTDCVWGAAVQAGDPVRWSLKEGHSLRATIDQNRHSGNGRRKSLRVNMEEGCFTMSLQVERQQKYRGQFSKGFTRERWCATFPTLTMAKALQPLWVHLKMQVADGQPILLPLVVTSTGAANNVECERLLRSRSRAPQRCLRIIGCRTTREWNRLTLVGGVDCWWTEVGGETKGRRLII